MVEQKLRDVLRTTAYHLKKLESMGLKRVSDLLYYFPRTYEDRSHMTSINGMDVNAINVIRGRVYGIEKKKSKQGVPFVSACLEDEQGEECTLLWFRQVHIFAQLQDNDTIIVSGRAKYERGRFTMMNPSFEKAEKTQQTHTGRIIPIYPESEKLTSDWIRTKIQGVLYFTKYIEDHLPRGLIEQKGLMDLATALKEIHFPSSQRALELAKERLAFDELLLLQCVSLMRKLQFKQEGAQDAKAMTLRPELIREFLELLPFELTDAQKIVLYEALRDMEKHEPMLRLLQGDVGSGKTVVATALAYHTIKQGHQAALMVPTEVLARQHHSSIAPLLMKQNIRIELLTGSVAEKKKQEVYLGLKQGTIDGVIGTHALIQEQVGFSSLGLVVIDEQHRFGVEQRRILASHGYPHVLQMTATPIPRTLTMTMYGDQDVSVISEMPKGRKPIITKVIHPRDRAKMYQFLRSYIEQGRQAYVICPLVEESDTLEVKSATEEYHLLAQQVFPDLRVALLHGKLSNQEKQQVMKDFKDHKYDLLVATSVIEVGIDVPNASIIVIEGAERFGLSQLHQFRGRVGRGEHQSFCLLATTSQDQARSTKLRAMEKTTDGFVLSQIDLDLRGPGEVFGIRQSGIPDLKIANIADTRLVKEARDAALALLEKDPTLATWPKLLAKVQERSKELSGTQV